MSAMQTSACLGSRITPYHISVGNAALCITAKFPANGSNGSCMDGARGAREKNWTFARIVRVQPCIRPLNAAVVAAGPDVIH
jgi:hypothetical protein